MQKSMEKLWWMKKFLSTNTRKRSKLTETMLITVYQSAKIVGIRLWSIFCFNVNSEFMFNQQFMKKTSKDCTLDFFWFLSKSFFPKFEQRNSGCCLNSCRCSLSVGVYGIFILTVCLFSNNISLFVQFLLQFLQAIF